MHRVSVNIAVTNQMVLGGSTEEGTLIRKPSVLSVCILSMCVVVDSLFFMGCLLRHPVKPISFENQ